MPRRKTEFTQGGIYHIYNRGVNRERIFFSPDNYLYLLKLLKRYSQKYQITIIAYCLMPNHYHLLVRQDGETAVSHLINVLFNAYVQAVNREYGRSGTLFGERFKDVQIEDEQYLKHLCRYIHANPVRAGIVTMLEDWPYSNYLEWIGERDGSLVDSDFVETYFQTGKEYTEFVIDYLRGDDKLPEDIQQYLFD